MKISCHSRKPSLQNMKAFEVRDIDDISLGMLLPPWHTVSQLGKNANAKSSQRTTARWDQAAAAAVGGS